MALRATIRSWLGIDERIRDVVRERLATAASAQDVAALQTRIDELATEVEKLSKKQKMTIGSVQAATSDLMGIHTLMDRMGPEAKKAIQQATIARNTAESTADGLEALESQVAALSESIANQTAQPAANKSTRRRK